MTYGVPNKRLQTNLHKVEIVVNSRGKPSKFAHEVNLALAKIERMRAEKTVLAVGQVWCCPRAGRGLLFKEPEGRLRNEYRFVRGEQAAPPEGAPAPVAAVRQEVETPVEIPRCASCKAPSRSTIGRFCLYCAHTTSMGERDPAEIDSRVARRTAEDPRSVAARRRLDADERRQRAPETATSRELAKPHPWEG